MTRDSHFCVKLTQNERKIALTGLLRDLRDQERDDLNRIREGNLSLAEVTSAALNDA